MASLSRNVTSFQLGTRAVVAIVAELMLAGPACWRVDAQAFQNRTGQPMPATAVPTSGRVADVASQVPELPNTSPAAPVLRPDYSVAPGTPESELMPLPPKYRKTLGPPLSNDLVHVPAVDSQPTDPIVRLDVTYLRQDFSMMFPVPYADPWLALQRFDFMVRTRVVSDEDAVLYRKILQRRETGTDVPYEDVILTALRELTGRDTAPTAMAWRMLLGLTSPGQP